MLIRSVSSRQPSGAVSGCTLATGTGAILPTAHIRRPDVLPATAGLEREPGPAAIPCLLKAGPSVRAAAVPRTPEGSLHVGDTGPWIADDPLSRDGV
jgi:hypothetical protein